MEAADEELELFFSTVMPHLNEVQRRVVAGAMARGLGRGGKTRVAATAGLSRNTVIKAQAEWKLGSRGTEDEPWNWAAFLIRSSTRPDVYADKNQF